MAVPRPCPVTVMSIAPGEVRASSCPGLTLLTRTLNAIGCG